MALQGVDAVKKAIEAKRKELNEGLKANYIMTMTSIVVGAHGGKGTPVHFKDGGTTRNNWFLSVGSPEYRTTVISAGKAGSSSMSQIAQMPTWVLGKKVYFTNSSPAILSLEYGGFPKSPKRGTYTGGGDDGYQILSTGGYSKQAPDGMVRVALRLMANRIKQL